MFETGSGRSVADNVTGVRGLWPTPGREGSGEGQRPMTKRGPFPKLTEGHGYSFTAGIVFKTALDAVRRCEATGAVANERIQSTDPFVAIVFAVASYEAFLNDLLQAANDLGSVGSVVWPILATDGDYLLNQKATAKAKTDLLHVFFTQNRCKWGVKPYQDWTLLSGLRNMLVHARPEGYVPFGEHGVGIPVYPDILKGLKARRILADVSSATWQALLQTLAAAQWSASTAVRMVKAIFAIMPNDAQAGLRLMAKPFLDYEQV